MKSILEHYNDRQLSHATLVVGNLAAIQAQVDELIKELTLNPADYLVFPADAALKIADARTIRHFIHQSRFTSPIKLVFLADATQLTPEAANALLKSLEEPPPKTHFILGTEKLDALLPTVRSRCQIFNIESTTEKSPAPLPPLPIPPLPKMTLAESFNLSKTLAAADTPLPTILAAWLRQTDNPAWQKTLLDYLGPAQTTVNRRLLLDNLLLDLYNSD